jgi:O-antigen/teichoic acid export membrane protein
MLRVIGLRITSQWIGSERTLTVYKNIFLSLFLKGAGIIISFLVIPITLAYVNTENFGIWMTISALTLWFGLIDVSFGNGLRNQLVASFAQNDSTVARALLSTLYVILGVGSIGLSFTFYFFSTYVNWSAFFHVGYEHEAIICQAIAIMLISFSIQIALKPINAVLLADQRASMTSWLLLAGNALSLICIYLATQYTQGSLLTLAYIQSLSPILVLIIANIYLFRTRYRHISPSIKCIDLSLVKQLFSTGSQFLFLQIISLLMFSSGSLVVTYFLGPKQVTTYSIANRYFGLIPMLYGIILTPYWSAFTDAYIKKDYNWILTTIKKLNYLATMTFVAAILMVQFADIAYTHWINENVNVPLSLSIAFATYSITYAFLCNYNYFINSVGKLRMLIYASIIGIIAFIPINYLLIIVFDLGLPGVVWVSTGWNITLLYICWLQSRKLLSGTANGIWNQ